MQSFPSRRSFRIASLFLKPFEEDDGAHHHRHRSRQKPEELPGGFSGPRSSVENDSSLRIPVLIKAGERGDETSCENQGFQVVRNFRAAMGLGNIVYRCAQTDGLLHRVESWKDEDLVTFPEEAIILHQAGLLIDLRCSSERMAKRANAWMSIAPGGSFEVQVGKYQIREPRQSRTCKTAIFLGWSRCVLGLDCYAHSVLSHLGFAGLRLEPLKPRRFVEYVESNWWTPQEKAQASMLQLVDRRGFSRMHISTINQKGLIGLNEAILETGKVELFEALRAMTLHLEHALQEPSAGKNKSPVFLPIVIYCVQGKDRTGMLVMLCQSIVGMADKDIISDYNKSDELATTCKASKSSIPAIQANSLRHDEFSRAPAEVMKMTLQYIRAKFGSIDNYLDDIGFDITWRARLKGAICSSDNALDRTVLS